MAVWLSGRGASFVVNHPLEQPGLHLWARDLEHRWLVETLQLPVPGRGSEQSVSVELHYHIYSLSKGAGTARTP